MRNSLRFNIIAVVLIVMLVVVSTLIFNTYIKLRNDIVAKNSESFATFYRVFCTEKELEINKYSMALDVLLDNPHVTMAFAERDKHDLAALTDNIYRSKLKPLYGIDQFQFHIPPAISFYRVHMPDKNGDNLASYRQTVVKANRYKTMVAGIETGRAGLGLRVVKPVWNNFNYAGTVEFGGNIDNILDSAKASTNIDYAVAIRQTSLKKAHSDMKMTGWLKRGGVYLYDFSNDKLKKMIVSNQDIPHDKIFSHGKSFYIMSAMPLYDYSSDNIGSIVLLKDVTTDVRAMHGEMIKQALLTALFGILSAFVISLVLFRLIFRPLRKITNHIRENEISANSVPKLIDTNGDRSEISMLAETFNSMSINMHKNLLMIKEQMEQINTYNINLEAKVKERTSELEIANQKLNVALENYKTINEAKSEFLADMSHEIRSPMNSVLGLSYLAMQTGLTAKQFDYVSKINKSASLMMEIINDVLDFSKIEAGKLELESVCFSLPDIMSGVKDILEVQAEKKKVLFNMHIAPNMPQYIKGDPLRLTQVLNNLGSNAVKFTERGTVDLTVDVLDSNMSYTTLKFTVKDTGIGIQKERIGTLFESYAQASADISRKYGGSGLGLNITKKILDKMGGSIFVESIPGQGSTFWFTLHMKNADITDTDDFAEKGKMLKGKRILVAEKYYTDPGSISSVYRQLLADVVSVDTRIDFLKILSTNINDNMLSFDLIVVESLMDCESPLAGLETLEQSIQNLVLPNIINISGEAADANIKGPVTVLEKPVSAALLVKTATRLLNGTEETDFIPEITSGGHCVVLIADDNSLNREIAGGFVNLLGADCVFAENGLEALKKSEKEQFDLIFLDASMPDMTGIKTAEAIRQTELNSGTMIYIMSIKDHETGVQEENKNTISGYITKPLSMPEISRIVLKASGKNNDEKNRILSSSAISHVDTDKGLQNFAGNADLYKEALTDMLQYLNGLGQDIHETLHSEKTNIQELLEHVAAMAENLAMPKLQTAAENAIKERGTENDIYSEAALILFIEELISIRTLLGNELK